MYRWIGSLRGQNTLRRKISRYVFPVTNGMETDRFRVDRNNEQDLPTAVMLSHVYELKGVMVRFDCCLVFGVWCLLFVLFAASTFLSCSDMFFLVDIVHVFDKRLFYVDN
tara:strand:+ start:44 stop:373 length:330 start_codon:yes stop_codon:yes gene_type:complete